MDKFAGRWYADAESQISFERKVHWLICCDPPEGEDGTYARTVCSTSYRCNNEDSCYDETDEAVTCKACLNLTKDD